MSRVASCPRCARQVSLPPGDDHSAWVRCPLCGAQYPLQAVLDYVPPLLEIVPPPALGAAEDALQAEHPSPHESSIDREHAPQMQPAMTAEIVAAGMPAADVFDSAIGLENEPHASTVAHPADDLHDGAEGAPAGELQLTDDNDVPFVAESDVHEISSHATDEHAPADPGMVGADADDHPFGTNETDGHEDHFGEDEFRFADEESAEHEMSSAEFGAAHDSPHEPGSEMAHPMGDIATMATKPPKKKRKVPLSVRLIGIGIFFGIGALGCYIVAAAFLYFGIADVPEFSRGLFPNALVAKSLQQQRTSGKNGRTPQTPPSMTQGQNPNNPDGKPNDSTIADASADSKNPTGAGDKSGDKPADKSTATDNGARAPADSDKSAGKPGAADAVPAGKADPATNPFDNPRPSDSDVAKDDSAKLDPLPGTSKPPSLDLPVVKPAKKSDSGTASPPDVPAGEKKPLEKPVETPPNAANQKPAEVVAPKSDVSFSLDDVAAAVAPAEQSSAALADAVKAEDEDKLKTARLANFRMISHLATVVTFAKPADAKEAEQLRTLKNQIAASLASSAAAAPEERELVGGFARVGVGSKARKESGLFMAGTLKKIEPRGKFYESQLELPGAMAPLVLVTPQKPAAAEGSDVMLLGAVVNEPTKNLAGYDGPADTVIFSDVLVAAPKDERAARTDK